MIDFKAPYNRTDFIDFLTEFLPDDFVNKEVDIQIDSKNDFVPKYATNTIQLGTCKSLELDIYEVTHTSTHDARVGIAQDAFKLMLHKSYNNRALVIFQQEGSKQYRFSLLQIEAEQKEHSARIKYSYSNPRRYSFLLGEGAKTKTPDQILLKNRKVDYKLKPKDGNLFKDLQERFSVEVLTKQFYKELSNWYFWAIKKVSFPNDINDDEDNQKYNPENVIRLITRLIFVWFLKQKDLIQSELFDKKILSDILIDFNSQSEKQDTYYRAILQNLFFATLNQEIDKRGFAENKSFSENKSKFNIKNLYRYENEFINKDTKHIMTLFSKVPFLNGGLFECLDGKIKDGKTYYWDGFSRSSKRQANVPNNLFFLKDDDNNNVDLSKEYNDPKMSSVKVSGIIEILGKYNFTVEENTPAEIEVALDPELLGKVFENLLGAFNPETQETARKQTGSFYTPREIVTYMVNESLLAYYQTNVPDIDEETIRILFGYEDREFVLNETQREALVKATFNCKILDPACGSGAFPMGTLQQMVHVISKLDPDNKYWYNIVLEQTKKEFGEVESEKDNDEKEELLKQVNKTFELNINYPDYTRKLYLIENCIYGVDIQSIAVQISKLRFFISLICEQNRSDDTTNNYGIRPLPNLETKFVAANTLIGIEKEDEDMQYINEDNIKKLVDKLQHIRHRQFSVTNSTEKKKLREKDEQIRFEIVNEVARLYKLHADEHLERYKKELFSSEKELKLLSKMPDEFRTSSQTDLFGNKKDTHFNFTESKRKEISQRIKLLERKISDGSDYSRLNSVVKLAEQLTSWNPYDQNESSPFFDPEWMFGLSKENAQFKPAETGYFDVVLGNPPYVVTKKGEYIGYKWEGDLYTMFFELAINKCMKNKGVLSFITPRFFLFNQNNFELRKVIVDELNIISMIECSPFDAITENEITILTLDKQTKNYIDFFKHKNGNFYFLNSLRKEWIKANTLYEINPYLTESVFNILKILVKTDLFQHSFKSKRGAEIGKKELRNSNDGKTVLLGYDVNRFMIEPSEAKIDRHHKEYIRLKSLFDLNNIILLRRVSKDLVSAVSTTPVAFSKNLYGIIVRPDFDSYYLCALLNSKLLNFYYKKKFSTKKEDVFPEIQTYLYEQLPIKEVNSNIQEKIASIARKISTDIKNGINTSIQEQQIDNLVYKLYELTYEEVKVIDPAFELTEIEYNNLQLG
ncbi:MAG: TaqI-like C-terminal specificity domain-containing protein [Paludibacteraceae bacterium]